MTPQNKRLRLSLNRNIHNKDPKSPRHFAEGFDATEITLEELVDLVSNGIAFSYQFKKGHRKSANFVATDFLALDFDGGVGTKEILQHPLVRDSGSLYYTTVSHSESEHRFRLVFVLPRTITRASELKQATKALATRLGSDPSATDAARWFAGSSGCSIEQLGGSISSELLDELIADGKATKVAAAGLSTAFSQKKAGRRIRDSELVRMPNGNHVIFGEIVGKQAVFCPFHTDKNPSAFVAKTKRGKYLTCSSCGQTWWSESAVATSCDFSDFDAAIKSLKVTPRIKLPEELLELEEFMGQVAVTPKNLTLQSGRYLEVPANMISGSGEGIYFIKSPKGSGKTTFLRNLLSNSEQSILVIGHRKTLIGEICERLGLVSYLDYPKSKGFYADEKHMRRFGVCVDSLFKVHGRKYDVIVLDEVEQVLKHFMGNTVGEKRRQVFQYFATLVSNAKQIIALDADLGWLSFMTLNALKNSSTIDPARSGEDSFPVHILLNEYHVQNRRLEVFRSKTHLIADMIDAVSHGKRVFVTSNNRALIDRLNRALLDSSKVNSSQKKILAVTSENSMSAETQAFIADIRNRILDYDVVLCSPSLGTGVDITFPDDKQEIDCVYGFFEGNITNHFDIDQQLGRVRNPKEVKIWVSDHTHDFETDFEIVRQDLLDSAMFEALDYGVPGQNADNPNVNYVLLVMATLACIKDRASINNLKANLLTAKHAAGWQVFYIEQDDEKSRIGGSFERLGEHLSDVHYLKGLQSANILKESEYKVIKKRRRFGSVQVSEDDTFDYWRTALEKFYREQMTPELISFDDRGRTRNKILLYENLIEAGERGETLDSLNTPFSERLHRNTHLSVVATPRGPAALLNQLLRHVPAYDNGRFDANVTYSNHDLSAFVEEVASAKCLIEGQLKMTVRQDFRRKPIQFLGVLLSLVGLDQERTRQSKDCGKRIRHYSIGEGLLAHQNEICARRSQIGAWAFLRSIYGLKETPEGMDILVA